MQIQGDNNQPNGPQHPAHPMVPGSERALNYQNNFNRNGSNNNGVDFNGPPLPNIDNGVEARSIRDKINSLVATVAILWGIGLAGITGGAILMINS